MRLVACRTAGAWLQRRHLSKATSLREMKASRVAEQWIHALEKAPCLVCGAAPAAAHRIDCTVSGFPLTCSHECDGAAVAQRHQELQMFKQIHEDLDYATSADARTLLTTVITRQQRAKQRLELLNEGALDLSVKSWEAFTRHFTSDEKWLQDAKAVRLVSAAYSFVATLSSFLPVLCPSDATVPRNLNLHVVGACAEAMMPRHIWEELVDSHECTDFQIKLIGDHVVPLSRKNKKQPIHTTPPSLQLEYCPGFYHQVASESPVPDAFVLFNPGIGHPKLRESWRPTMEMILALGKPVLLTSFSHRDQERDVNALDGMRDVATVDFLLAPQANAFRSRCFHLDPSDVFSPIQTNSHVMVVRGRGMDGTNSTA